MARPLTKRNSAGDLYVRPSRVEAQINEILSQNPATLRRRLTVGDPQSSDYLSSECLVHLARDFIRHGNEAANAVLRILLDRCEAILLSKIPDNELSNAAYVREEVLGQFGLLFATDGMKENRDRLDYFECRFNRAFRTFRISQVRKELTHQQHFVPTPDQADAPQSDSPTQAREALQSPETAENAVLQELREAIDTLPNDERRAVILYYIKRHKIESKNPDEETVATICNVSGRTIRNRLSRAVEKLSNFREDL